MDGTVVALVRLEGVGDDLAPQVQRDIVAHLQEDLDTRGVHLDHTVIAAHHHKRLVRIKAVLLQLLCHPAQLGEYLGALGGGPPKHALHALVLIGRELAICHIGCCEHLRFARDATCCIGGAASCNRTTVRAARLVHQLPHLLARQSVSIGVVDTQLRSPEFSVECAHVFHRDSPLGIAADQATLLVPLSLSPRLRV